MPVVVVIRHVVAHAETAVMFEVFSAFFGGSIAVIDVIVVVLVEVVTDDVIPSVVVEIADGVPNPYPRLLW